MQGISLEMKGVLRLQCIHLPPLHFTKKKGSKQGHSNAPH
jgi:hypothetical protein